MLRCTTARLVLTAGALAVAGCGPAAAPKSDESVGEKPADVKPTPAVDIVGLRRRLGIGESGLLVTENNRIVKADLRNTRVRDLSALKGQPLRELYLESTAVVDISPLKGMPLEKLFLNQTQVEDISAVEGMPLRELNLYDSNVSDVSAVSKSASLETIWLKGTQVADVSPLAELKLVSLDVSATPVSDLSALAEMTTLVRLNIARSKVTDLTPLKKLTLSRLIFTPGNIRQGLDVVRNMSSLRELDVEMREPKRLTPAVFWRQYQLGGLDD